MTQPESPTPSPSVPAESNPAPTAAVPAATPTTASPVLSAAPGAQPRKIRWLTLVLIAVPIAGAILLGRHLYLNADSTKEAEQIAKARQQAKTFPTQPERAYGYWQHLADEPTGSASLKATAREEIQKLIDTGGLTDRFEALITELLRRGENDMGQSTAYAKVLLQLSQTFKTKETPADAQRRIDRLQAIGDGYRDAINDRVARGQYDKALEKLTKLYADYPEAEFVRPVIARIQCEVAEAMISLDDLEGAKERLEAAIKVDPLATYRDRLEALQRSMKSLDPAPYIAAGKQAEAVGDWPTAQSQYEKALQLRRSNKEAAAGYTRMLKFYAEVFLKNAEESGELSEDGAKFVKLAAENARKMAQYGDPELVLARADLLLAEAHFQEENIRDAKQLADGALDSIARDSRTTQQGSYLMARIFKLYYHLGKNMNRLPQARQSLALADEYCRLALEKGHPKAGNLFVQINNLTRIEQETGGSLNTDPATGGRDTRPTQDASNLVNEGPLGQTGPLDVTKPGSVTPVMAEDKPPKTTPGNMPPAAGDTPAAPAATDPPASPGAPTGGTPKPDPSKDKLLNPLQ